MLPKLVAFLNNKWISSGTLNIKYAGVSKFPIDSNILLPPALVTAKTLILSIN